MESSPVSCLVHRLRSATQSRTISVSLSVRFFCVKVHATFFRFYRVFLVFEGVELIMVMGDGGTARTITKRGRGSGGMRVLHG